MASLQPTPSNVSIELPSWFGGGVPRAFLQKADLHVWPSRTGKKLRIQTGESYRRQRPLLLELLDLAGPTMRAPRFESVANATRGHDFEHVDLGEPILKRLAGLQARVDSSDDILDSLYYWKVACSLITGRELPTHIEKVHRSLVATKLQGSPDQRPLSNASAHILLRSRILLFRAKLPTIMLRVAHDEQLAQGETAHVQRLIDAGESAFASGEGLLAGMYSFDSYVGPLLGALSPGVWGFAGIRGFGLVVFGFGRCLNGVSSEPAEMLHLLLPGVRPSGAPYQLPDFDADTCSSALRWWVNRLCNFFGVLSDPVVFADSSGGYNAARHHQVLMTAEQLFQRVTSIVTSYRDEHARRALLFTVLDTVERFTRRDIETLCRYSSAKKTLEMVKASIPEAAQPLLIPGAERGLAALKDLQKGFFLHGSPDLSIEKATARYVRVLRNATHGHGSNKIGNRTDVADLLARHNGDIPSDLPMLGYLYLLGILAEPDTIRKILQSDVLR